MRNVGFFIDLQLIEVDSIYGSANMKANECAIKLWNLILKCQHAFFRSHESPYFIVVSPGVSSHEKFIFCGLMLLFFIGRLLLSFFLVKLWLVIS